MEQTRKNRDEALRNLTRILAFGQSESKGELSSVPIGISSIDRDFTQSKLAQQDTNNNKSKEKQLQDLDTILREFA